MSNKKYLDLGKAVFARNKNIFENFSYLTLLQIINIAFPLLTYKYFIDIFGVKLWGLIIFAQSIALYLSILINFGFDKSASKLISVNRNDRKKVSEIISSILIIKAILFLIAFFILVGLILVFEIDRGKPLLFLFSFGICFNEFLFPQWYFQGLEKLKYPVIINGCIKVIFLILMVVIIKNKNQYLLVPIFNGLAAFVGGIIAIFVVFRLNNERFKFQGISILFSYFKESLPLFASNAIISVKDRMSLIFIGSFLGMAEVAYYDLGLKILGFVNQPATIMNNAIYPKVAIEKNMVFVRKIASLTFLIVLILVSVLYFMAPYVIELLLGEKNSVAISVTRILLVSPLVLVFSLFLAVNCLLIFDKYSVLLKGMLWTTSFYLILIWIGYSLEILNQVVVFAIITVMVYLFELFYRWYVVKKYRLI